MDKWLTVDSTLPSDGCRGTLVGRAWLPGPDVPLSLTAVENLASACLAALHWPPGAYNIADDVVYRRDEAVAAVLGVGIRNIPIRVARAAAMLPGRTLTRYGIDQVTDGMVLDITKALATWWRPDRTLTSW